MEKALAMDVGPIQCSEIVIVKKKNCNVSEKDIEKVASKYIPMINKELKALCER